MTQRTYRRYAIVVPVLVGIVTLLAPACAASSKSAAITTDTPITSDHGAGHETGPTGDIEFGPAPPVFPPGAEMAVIQGDPSVAGEVFTVRLRFPDGYILPAHWHPTDEFVTSISGTFLVGLGDAFDEGALLPVLEPGDFVLAPADANHFATARGDTEIQVHAIGPFELTYVDPDDDPRNAEG